MAGKRPLVTIGMPVYNGGQLLGEAIETLLAQEVNDFELVISDNASTDSTPQLCQKYANSDKRIRYYRNAINIGALPNFDRAAQLAEGKYFMWACHDDRWDPQFLSACTDAVQRDKCVLAYPNSRVYNVDTGEQRVLDHTEIGTTLGIRSPTERLARLYRASHFWALFFGLMPTEVVKRLLPNEKVHSNDSVFVALLALTGQFVHVPEVLFTFQTKDQSDKKRQSAGFLGVGQAKSATRYKSFRPTARAICRRARQLDLSMRQRWSVYLKTLRWYISEERIIRTLRGRR